MQGSTSIWVCCLVILAWTALAAPPPPVWDELFIAGGVSYGLYSAPTPSIMYYNWTSMSQLMISVDANGVGHSILNTQQIVWSIFQSTGNCCIDPTQTGVSPPMPTWLTNSTYQGQVLINEVPCHGWQKDEEGIVFGWYTSIATGRPFRLTFQENVSIWDFSYYSTDPQDFPTGIFDVPEYCPFKVTNPNCSIVVD